jgi:hypothetical protein
VPLPQESQLQRPQAAPRGSERRGARGGWRCCGVAGKEWEEGRSTRVDFSHYLLQDPPHACTRLATPTSSLNIYMDSVRAGKANVSAAAPSDCCCERRRGAGAV